MVGRQEEAIQLLAMGWPGYLSRVPGWLDLDSGYLADHSWQMAAVSCTHPTLTIDNYELTGIIGISMRELLNHGILLSSP